MDSDEVPRHPPMKVTAEHTSKIAMSGTEMAAAASMLNQPAENYGNDASLEAQWAMKAFHHAETYFKLISAVDASLLKLTPIDDDIYKKFREDFKEMNVNELNETEMKSDAGKAKWREFCNLFEKKVEDWNMGTLLRLRAAEEITDKNTTLVPRIQFLAIEIARNREGYNAALREKKSAGDS